MRASRSAHTPLHCPHIRRATSYILNIIIFYNQQALCYAHLQLFSKSCLYSYQRAFTSSLGRAEVAMPPKKRPAASSAQFAPKAPGWVFVMSYGSHSCQSSEGILPATCFVFDIFSADNILTIVMITLRFWDSCANLGIFVMLSLRMTCPSGCYFFASPSLSIESGVVIANMGPVSTERCKALPDQNFGSLVAYRLLKGFTSEMLRFPMSTSRRSKRLCGQALKSLARVCGTRIIRRLE